MGVKMELERKERAGQRGVGIYAEALRSSPEGRGGD